MSAATPVAKLNSVIFNDLAAYDQWNLELSHWRTPAEPMSAREKRLKRCIGLVGSGGTCDLVLTRNIRCVTCYVGPDPRGFPPAGTRAIPVDRHLVAGDDAPPVGLSQEIIESEAPRHHARARKKSTAHRVEQERNDVGRHVIPTLIAHRHHADHLAHAVIHRPLSNAGEFADEIEPIREQRSILVATSCHPEAPRRENVTHAAFETGAGSILQ